MLTSSCEHSWNKHGKFKYSLKLLEQQKHEIAMAFRQRYLKERIFESLKKEAGQDERKKELRRCWVKLRIEASIQKILQEYRGWV